MFDSYTIDSATAPWGKKTVKATFNEDYLSGYSSTVVEDTKDPYTGARLTTLIARFPRCILPEINTHRVFSRNSASSRARSIRSTIGGVMHEPYIPLFTVNHKGMGGDYLTGDLLDDAKRLWLKARDSAVSSELSMLLGSMYTGSTESVREDWEHWIDVYYDNVYHADAPIDGVPSVHKQNANRLIEPFMWHEALITSSYWDNFYKLRIDDAAQPEMHAVAILMRASMNASTPKESPVHIPFETFTVDNGTPFSDINNAFIASASECARISYKDRSSIGLAQNNELGKRMLRDGHMSPFEHQAISIEFFKNLYEYNDDADLSGNLSPEWIQYRHLL
jgi:hypothetical protein